MEPRNCGCPEIPQIPQIDVTPLEPYFIKYAGSGPDREEDGLIPVLQKAQELYGYLPDGLLAYIARRLGIKPAKVIGVVTFYTQFRTKPAGKHLIMLCQGTACHVNGSGGIEEALRDYLRVDEGGITPDGLFTYNNVACIGCCSLSPVMMIDGKAYGSLTKESAAEILDEIKRGAEI